MLMDSFDGKPCAEVLKKCKEMGKMTVLDTAWDSQGRWMKVLEPCMPYIDVFLPSIDEAAELAGTRDLDAIADFFFSKGVKQVAICVKAKMRHPFCFRLIQAHRSLIPRVRATVFAQAL